MQKRLEYSHQSILILSQQAKCNLTSPSEGTYTLEISVGVKLEDIFKLTIVPVSAKGINHVMSQSEWYHLGLFERMTLVKETVKINM